MTDTDYAQVIHQAMNELTEQFARPIDVETSLAGITAAAVDLIDTVHSADVLLIEHSEEHRSVATTSELSAHLDGLQRRHGQGPCIDAAIGEVMVISHDLAREPRWPDFSPRGVEAGVRSVMSFQLYTHQKRPTCRAALNLFSHHPQAFDHDAQAIAAMLATHAAITFIADARETQLQSALASRDAIGQAKGMIMERFHVNAVHAFDLLRKLSQDTNTRLVDVAAQVVATGPAT